MIGDQILLFSRSLITLDYIEQWLAFWNEQSSSVNWEKGVDYFRIDGKQTNFFRILLFL